MLDFFESTTESQTTEASNAADLHTSDTVEATTDETVENKTQGLAMESDESDQPAAPSLKKVSLKLDDAEYDLDLPEPVADKVKNGIMMQADYTRSKQELSEKQKALESQKAEFDAVMTEARNQLEFQQDELNSEEMQELKEYDPEAYYKRVNAFNDRVAKYNDRLKKRNEELASAHNETVQNEMKNYPNVIPEWLDESVKKQEMQMIGKFLEENGFEEKDINQLYPAKVMKMARQAALYDKAIKSAQGKKQNDPPKSTSPRSTNEKQASQMSLYDVMKAQQEKK